MIPFVKLQGLGNDFVLIDDLGKPPAMRIRLGAELARDLCDRRRGVGADQVLWLKDAAHPEVGGGPVDARMEIFNADGSVAEMCGNGIRAVGLYLYRHGPARRASYRIETLAGVREVRVGDGGEIAVDMGPPVFGGADEPLQVAGFSGRLAEVSLGNPHAVFFLPQGLEAFPLAQVGPLIENLPRFPQRTNVEFAQVRGPSALSVRVWERGAGLTQACGTGACAAAAVALRAGLVRGPVEVSLPGGTLVVSWVSGEPIWMRGPAEEIFRGEYFQKQP